MRKERNKRVLAWLLAVVLTISNIQFSVFAQTAENETVQQMEENKDSGPGQETVEEVKPQEQQEAGEPQEPAEPQKPQEAGEPQEPAEPQKPQEAGEPQEPAETQKPAEAQESETPKQVYTKATVSVLYSDVQNIANRRLLDGNQLLEVYADGKRMEEQPEITLDNESYEEQFKAQRYVYTLHNLPVYRADSSEKISYTVKEENIAYGYTAFTKEAFKGLSDTQAEEIRSELASPDAEVKLFWEEEENTLKADKKFGNYLPAYEASGTVTWKSTDSGAVRPDMENYFKHQFQIVRGEQPYTDVKLHYEQDKENADCWNFTVEGLFTTEESKNSAVYTLKAGEVEGYRIEQSEAVVQGDNQQIEFVYKPRGKKARMLKAEPNEEKVTKSVKKEWIDNHNKFQKRVNLLQAEMLELHYTIAGKEEQTWKPGQLGIDSPMSEWEEKQIATVKAEGVGWETYTFSLPKTWEGKEISYSFTENSEEVTANGYLEYKGTDENLHNVITTTLPSEDEKETDLSFKVKVNQGALKEINKAKKASAFAQFITIRGESGGNKVSSTTLADLGDSVKWSEETNGETTVSVKNLPIYTKEGDEIVYELSMSDTSAAEDTGDAKDKWAVSYDNEKSSNFGTVTTECHKNGTLIITLTGEQDYTATKIWMDDRTDATKEKRPDAVLHLWRYSKRSGNDYKNAAMVKNPLETAKNISWEIGDADENTVTTKDTELAGELSKYDQEGYEYVYFTKEILTKNEGDYTYQKYMGKYNPDKDCYEETLPEGIVRTGADTCVYNNGIISNTIVGEKNAALEKTWKASSFQGQLEDVSVEFHLQKRLKKAAGEPEAEWTDTEIIETMEKFFAEDLTKTVEKSMPQYNKGGEELEYRWVEADIRQNGESVLLKDEDGSPKLDDAGNMLFVLKQKDAGGNEQAITYRSRLEQTDGRTYIYNEIQEKTDYTVKKIWDDADTVTNHSPITIVLYRDFKEYVRYTMQGSEQAESVLNNEDDVKAEESADWQMKFSNLPKYDPSGHEYSYYAVEEQVKGYHATYQYDDADWDAVITNTPGEAGKSIFVRKEWLDDGDSTHRVPVQVEIYNKNTDEVIKKITLDAEHFWWQEVAIPTDTNVEHALAVREVSLGDLTVDKDYMTASTDEHQYEITYQQNPEDDALGMFVVKNRRIGVVNIEATKKWKDKEKVAGRLDNAALQLTCDSAGAVIGEKNVKLDGLAPQQVKDNDGNEVNVEQKVDTTDGKTYYFYNLPKYDKDGKVVHYKVEEKYPDDNQEYVQKLGAESYEVGKQHTSDMQRLEITNKKENVKEVKFYKLWKDTYNFEQDKRPDIYLTLYRQTEGKEPEVMPEYMEHLWTRDAKDSDYLWTCFFGNLPKYDEEGAEIFYYALESSQVNRENLDYLVSEEAVYDEKQDYINEYGYKKDAQGVANETATVADGKEVLKENGTFVNRISAPIQISGKKLWKNVPAGTPKDDFPELIIHIMRKLSTAKDEADLKKVASTSNLTYIDGTNEFTFEVAEDDDKKPLQKYDENGVLYQYSVEEETPTDDNYNPTYVKDPEINNYKITNIYNVDADGENTGRLQVTKNWVTKNWTGTLPKDGKYPAVQFKLYRQYQSKDAAKNTAQIKVEGKDIDVTEPELVETVRIAASDKESVAANFPTKNLRIRAANQKPYYYYIEEEIVHGYSYEGDKKTEIPKKTGSFTLINSKNTAHVEAIENSYTPENEKVTLSGKKVWQDWDGKLGDRPSLEDFKKEIKVYRYAEAQAGESGAPAIDRKEITVQGDKPDEPYYIKWTPDSDSDSASEWQYTISNLERYAPNAQPWKYVVEEKQVDKYAGSPKVTSGDETKIEAGVAAIASDGAITMQNLENRILKSAAIEKKWSDEDKNAHNLRPAQILVKLQFKTEPDGTWKDATYEAFQETGYSGDEEYFEKRILENYPVEAKKDWKLTVDNLPAYINGEPCSYRFVETGIGGANENDPKFPVTNNGETVDKLTYQAAGGYLPKQVLELKTGVDNTDKTTITNTIQEDEFTTLKVTKQWDDSANAYNTRPGTLEQGSQWKITVELQRSQKPDVENSWSTVQDINGKDVEKTISGSGNEQEVTFAYLPLSDNNGNEYHYRAIEKDVQDGYNVSYTHTPRKENTDCDSTVIINQMNTTSLHMKKEWKEAGGTVNQELGAGKTLTFEVKKEKDQLETSFVTPKTIVLDGNTDGVETNPWEAEITDLPKLDGVTYVVRETDEPAGFVKTEVTKKDEKNSGYESIVTNTQIEFELKKLGTYINEDGEEVTEELTGASFGIYTNKAGAKGYKVRDCEAGVIKRLPKGDYILVEEKAPAGYLTMPDICFTVTEKGEISGTKSDYVSFDEHKITVTDKRISGAVKLTKYLGAASAGKTLAGVGFNLHRGDDNSPVKTELKTDNNGELIVENLPVGKYYFQECSATADSVLDSEKKIEFEITANQDSTKQPQMIELGAVENKVFAADVVFTKTDAADNRPVKDAHFQLQYTPQVPKGHAVGYSDKEWTTDENGRIQMGGLQKGSYQLTEVSAAGYSMAADDKFICEFKITEADNGKTLKLDKTSGFAIKAGMGKESTDSQDYQVNNVRLPGTVSIRKQSDDDEALNGAVFALTKIKEADGSEVNQRFDAEFKSGLTYQADKKGLIEDKSAEGGKGVLTITGLDWGTYVLEEIKAPAGYKLEPGKKVEFKITRDSLELTAEANGHQVVNVRNAVTLKKVKKGDASTVLPGAEFVITNVKDKTEKISTGATDANGTLVLEGKLRGGETYRLHETKAPSHYLLNPESEDIIFKMEENGSLTIDGKEVSDNTLVVENEPTGLRFRKVGKLHETCSDITLNAPNPKETEPLSEVEFKIYQNGEEKGSAVSDADGWVEFKTLPVGEYEVRETSVPAGYEDNTAAIYRAVISDNPKEYSGIRDKDGNPLPDNEVVNDKYRTDISFTKVNEQNQEEVLPGSVYGLYKKVLPGERQKRGKVKAGEELQLIAKAVTDKNGRLVFKGVLMNTEYIIRELKAPDGSYISENPIRITFKVEGNEIKVKDFDDGSGTAKVDDDGNIIWLEPSVLAAFRKLDEEGKPLPGAKLQVQDADGKVIEEWISEDKPYISSRKLALGQTYRLVEISAPDGYTLAEPLTFRVDDAPVGPGEEKIISLEMKDKVTVLNIKKIAENTDRILEGAEFEIKGVFADGSKVQVLNPDETGSTLEKLLIVGNQYQITETKAPQGYEKLKTPIIFTVNGDGRPLTAENENRALVLEKADGYQLHIKNRKQQIQNKPDDTSEEKEKDNNPNNKKNNNNNNNNNNNKEDKPETKVTGVKTADEKMPLCYGMVAILSLGTACAAEFTRRRKRR